MAATIDDSQLLADYVRTRSTDALGQLIERHLDFVHAAAVRQVQDAALAEDVTQAVFIILMRKAASIRPGSLVGWLFNTTRYCAANAKSSELRRRRHERQAAKPEVQMQSDNSIAVPLDDALAALRSSDRQVVLLRYMEQRDFAEVATVLGISEQTARRRLGRAIEHLRHLLSAAGSLLPSAGVLAVLSNATPKAPVHLLAKTIATVSASATTAGAAGALATQTIHMMTWLKLKIAAAILLAAAVAGAGSVAVVKTMQPQAQSAASVAPMPATTPPPPAVAPAATPGAIATFPDGLRVELIGVAPSPINGKRWWQPDGSPLPKAPFSRSSGQVSGGFGSTPFEFAVRVTGDQPGWSTGISIPGSMGTASGEQHGIMDMAALLPPNPTTTIDFTCATGPWQTRAIIPANAVFSTGYMLNNTISFTKGKDPKNTSITIVADYASMKSVSGGDQSFVAIGFDSKATGTNSWSSTGGLLTQTIDLSFPKIRPEQIKEFQIRTRPFNRSVKFQNVSLIPGQLTAPTVEQHDSGNFSASFAAGGSFEVVGISDWSSPHKWWNADGTARDEIPVAEAGRDIVDGKRGDKTYAIAMKWDHHDNHSALTFSFTNSHSNMIINAARLTPESPDIFLFTCPPDATNTNLRVGMASGQWQVSPAIIPDGHAVSVTVGKDKVDFSSIQDQNGQATITVTDALSDVVRQLVVTDKSGATHFGGQTRGVRQGGTYQNSYRIPQVSSAQIKSYLLRTCRFEYTNFNNISLKPDQHTEITIEPDKPPTPAVPTKPPGEEGL